MSPTLSFIQGCLLVVPQTKEKMIAEALHKSKRREEGFDMQNNVSAQHFHLFTFRYDSTCHLYF